MLQTVRSLRRSFRRSILTSALRLGHARARLPLQNGAPQAGTVGTPAAYGVAQRGDVAVARRDVPGRHGGGREVSKRYVWEVDGEN